MQYQSAKIGNFGILRAYGENSFKLSCLSVYSPGGTENRNFTDKGMAGNTEKLDNSISRTRSTIFEYAMCNPWEYFVTLTLDQTKYDRNDLPKFIKDLSQYIRDFRKREKASVSYLLVPERHKNGCWHLHGLLMGIEEKRLHHFTEEEHLPYAILEELHKGREIFTWKDYERKFGYCTFSKIENQEATSRYITKYITKETMNTIQELNAHSFYASHGLQHSQILIRDILEKPIENPDYCNDYCKTKWYNIETVEEAVGLFGEVIS